MRRDMRADTLVKADTLGDEPVQIGSGEARRAVYPQPVLPQAVDDDPDDIHGILRGLCPPSSSATSGSIPFVREPFSLRTGCGAACLGVRPRENGMAGWVGRWPIVLARLSLLRCRLVGFV